MHLRIRLPGGLLKFKHERYLRRRERNREYPTWQLGSYFFIWIPRSLAREA